MTAKSKGIKKGDWVVVTTSGFYGKVLQNAHTQYPTCYVLGLVSEVGGVWFEEITKLSDEFSAILEETHAKDVKIFKAPFKASEEK